MIKNPPTMWDTWVWYLGWEDSLEEDMATHSRILAWRIPMDRGAWRATFHEVAKSQTQLSNKAQHSIYIYIYEWLYNYFYFLPWCVLFQNLLAEIKGYIKITSHKHLFCNTFRIPFGSIEIDFIYKPSELFLGIHFIYKPLQPFKTRLYNLRFFFKPHSTG